MRHIQKALDLFFEPSHDAGPATIEDWLQVFEDHHWPRSGAIQSAGYFQAGTPLLSV